MRQLLLIFCMIKKKKIYPAHVSKLTQTVKTSYSFNDFKRIKTIALPCSKKIIGKK